MIMAQSTETRSPLLQLTVTSRPHPTANMPNTGSLAKGATHGIAPESFLWLMIGIMLILVHPNEMASWSAVALFGRRSFLPFLSPEHRNQRRTKQSHVAEPDQPQQGVWRIPGEQGLAILILSSLWTLVRPFGYSSSAWVLPWALASRTALMTRFDIPLSATSILVGILGLFGLFCHTSWQWWAPGKILAAHFLGYTLQHVKTLKQVFSVDEWQIVVFLAAGVWLEWMQQVATKRYHRHSMHHGLGDDCTTLVACAGNIGVVLATSWVSTQTKVWPLWWQIIVLLSLPLLLVEVSLAMVSTTDRSNARHGYNMEEATAGILLPPYLIPRCIQWVLQFLMRVEEPLWGTIAPMHVPRILWLLYWAVISVTGLLAAPTSPSRVVSRKWFHGVAILLFTPVTMYAPFLQSLGYAIAVAVLVALEGVRPNWPAVQRFYTRYLDPSKDGRPGDKTNPTSCDVLIISHTALILGCAMPLWCYQMSDARMSPFIPFGGILVLGVGDALGAIVGKWYGKIKWSTWIPGLSQHNKRTLEGSLAMLGGQAIFVVLLQTSGIPVQWSVIGPTIIFVSLLEAWTIQMDNIMIPLAFVAFMGLWEQLAV